VAGCCEYGDEPSGSCATELVSLTRFILHFHRPAFFISWELDEWNKRSSICSQRVRQEGARDGRIV
jgi:hypothetical protein